MKGWFLRVCSRRFDVILWRLRPGLERTFGLEMVVVPDDIWTRKTKLTRIARL
jgi:hypothetical protein